MKTILVNQTSAMQGVPQIDAIEKVTGRAKFTVDIELPRMLHAKVMRSPHAHAIIRKIDTSNAKKLQGVKTIITSQDTPRISYNSGDKHPPAPRGFLRDKYILDNHLRYVGDEVAAVAAESEAIAEKAISLIEVEYDVLRPVIDPEEAMKPEAPQLHPDLVKNNIVTTDQRRFGDAESGFQEADYIFEDKYYVQPVTPFPIEPHITIADYDDAGALTIWTSTQDPFPVRGRVAAILGLKESQVKVIVPYVGGGFGCKDETITEPICALLSKATRRPVRLAFTQDEMTYASRRRHSGFIYLKTGVKKNGIFTARHARVVYSTGAYASHGSIVTHSTFWKFILPYNTTNVSYDGYCVYTNTPIAGAYRGYGNPQICFARETQIDKIAYKLGIDPLQIRMQNVRRQGELDPITDSAIESCGLEACLKKGAEAFEWDKKRRAGTSRQGGRRVGVGVACVAHGTGTQKLDNCEFATARVELNDDGTVFVTISTIDMGQGMRTTLAIIAAQELGIDIQQVRVVTILDTDLIPFDKGTFASRTSYVMGNAVRLAAIQTREKLLEHASTMLNVPLSNLKIKDGLVTAENQRGDPLTIQQIVYSAIRSSKGPITAQVTYVPPGNPPGFGAQFVELEVDTANNSIKLLRILAAHEAGKIINPIGAVTQVRGSVIQAIGQALTEDMGINEETGETMNLGFRKYHIPRSVEVPPIDVLLVEDIIPSDPYAAKGLGEQAIGPTAAAIGNAFYHATGTQINELPLTHEKVEAALRKSSEER